MGLMTLPVDPERAKACQPHPARRGRDLALSIAPALPLVPTNMSNENSLIGRADGDAMDDASQPPGGQQPDSNISDPASAAPLVIIQYDHTADSAAGNDDTDGTDDEEAGGADGDGDDGDDLSEGEVTQIQGVTVIPKRAYRSKAAREAVKGQRRGNPGKFHGEVFEFLAAGLEDFKIANRPGRGKIKRVKVFFYNILGEFWKKFDWKQFTEPQHEDDQGLVIEETNAV